MTDLVNSIRELYASKAKQLSEQFGNSPLKPSLMKSLQNEQKQTEIIGRVIQDRLNYLRDTYNKQLEEIRKESNRQMWREIASIIGEVGGQLLGHYLFNKQDATVNTSQETPTEIKETPIEKTKAYKTYEYQYKEGLTPVPPQKTPERYIRNIYRYLYGDE